MSFDPIVYQEIRKLANLINASSSPPLCSLVNFPAGFPNLITVGMQKYLKTGVTTLQAAFPSIPVPPIPAFGSCTVVDKGFLSDAPIAFGNGVFVTLSTNQNSAIPYFRWSVDGKTWTQGTRQTVADGMSLIIFDRINAKFVAIGVNSVWSSSDGKVWTLKASNLAALADGFNPSSLAFGNGTYVALSTNGVVLTSADLITWVNRTTLPVSTQSFVIFDDTNFVFAIGIAGGSTSIYTSANGYTTTSTVSLGNVAGIYAMFSVAGKIYLSVGSTVFTSVNSGISWSSSPMTGASYPMGYVNGMFVGVNSSLQVSADTTLWKSLSGINTSVYGPSFTTAAAGGAYGTLPQIAFGNGVIVCNGTNSNIDRTSKALVYGDYGLYIDNFNASVLMTNPFYMRIQ